MKKSLYNSILLPVLVAILLIAGCEPADFNYSKEVVFTAATGYDNLPGTKTVYTGTDVTVDGKPYELIDWVAGDQIRVMAHNVKTAANNPSAEYAVQSANINQHSGRNSTATVAKVGDGLSWSSTTATSDTFYAIYPSPSKNTNASIGVGTSNATIGGTIPATQNYTTHTNASAPDMDNAYMWAAKTASAGSTINLEFQPAFTAFQITITNRTASPLKINSLKLSSSSMAINGRFTGTISATENPVFGDFPAASDSNKEITVTGLPTAAIAVGGSASVTLFALPRNLQNMSIKMNVTSDGTTADKVLDLKQGGSFMTFTATKKYRISVDAPTVEEPWTYVVEPIDNITTYGHKATVSSIPFDVTSYKYQGDVSVKTPVAWTIEYSTDGTNWSTSHDGKIGVNITSGGGGSTLTVNNGANVLRDHGSGEYTGDDPSIEDAATAALRSAPDIPAVAKDTDGYYDLSKHPVYGSSQFGSPQSMETANCYVVQGPGLYKFPLVYGNAIRNGATNTTSYAPSVSSPAGHFLNNFVRHDGAAIAGPWITTDNSITVSDAIIVWQDGTSNAAGQIIKDADVSVDGDYIKFKVERDLIRPGNVVIAARNSSGTIVWSWHIWVTEKDLSPKSIKDGAGNTLSMMPYNLGWMDATSAQFTKYNNWTMYVRVSQTETGGASRTFLIRQIGDVISVDANVGCNTFYQWGRKDPMLPATGDNTDKAQYSAYGLTWQSASGHQITSGGLEQSILHPNWQLVNLNGTEAHYCGLNYGNLWDAKLDNGGSLGSYWNRLAIKTVYDPCPPGFVVPYAFAFSGVSKNANVMTYAYYPAQLWATYTVNIGYRFTIPSSDPMDFPFCGARAHDGNHGGEGTSIYDVKSLGYYWTSCPLEFNSTVDASGVQGKRAAKMMMMNDNVLIRPGHEQRKGAGYAVRPVIQTAF